jgi:heat shock protein HslJ
MRKVQWLIVLAVLVALALSGCAFGQFGLPLEGTPWVLQAYGPPDDLQDVLQGTRITALFDAASHQVSGSAGCNTYAGSYLARGTALRIGRLAWTEMACLRPQGVMEQEQRYLRLLGAAEGYQIQPLQLRIHCQGDQVLLFRPRLFNR